MLHILVFLFLYSCFLQIIGHPALWFLSILHTTIMTTSVPFVQILYPSSRNHFCSLQVIRIAFNHCSVLFSQYIFSFASDFLFLWCYTRGLLFIPSSHIRSLQYPFVSSRLLILVGKLYGMFDTRNLESHVEQYTYLSVSTSLAVYPIVLSL